MLNFLAKALVKSPAKEAMDQLRVTKLELLEANAAKEHWEGRVTALKTRERRLQAQVDADARGTEAAIRENMATY
jgi:hypothetical protein